MASDLICDEIREWDQLVLSRDVVVRLEDQVCFHRVTGCVVELNYTGISLIAMLVKQRNLAEAAKALADKYELEVDQIRNDFFDLINDLISHRMIEKGAE